ncbi:MAG TPA: EAL domain-containing protein [Acetobacteraceae bacterium]|jgi:EAL domain-containing protein (putative c-di-GMP-specific phosphodiesterase class I)/DNA-binding CsgD family transcriptional regulator
MRVLVFDDDAAVGRLVVRVAQMAGLEAAAVTDAEAFAQRLRSDAPQLVMLDLQLGATDGVEQLRWLAGQQFKGALILMSGFDPRVLGTTQALGKSLGLQVEGVLEKPVRVEQLESMMARVQSASRSLSAERLLAAIAKDELVLDFQPVVSRHPKVLKKLEALVRWDHPVMGQIPPGDFLPLAEGDTAVIDALTDWVLSAAIDAYQVLRELGVSVPLAVNMSTRNLHDLSLPDRIEKRMRAAGMPAEHLCLEITESAAFKDAARTMDILSRIRLKGMNLSIDDFGTGYSSLKMLRQMPFTEIKIDQSFVGDAATSRDSRAIVKSIIDLAANMEMSCVAEGVETEQTANLLEQLGVCDMQGFLIAMPMPVEAIPSWLAAWVRSGPPTQPDRPIGAAPTDLSCPANSDTAAPSITLCGDARALARLSPRQLEVMQVLSQGCSAKEIARRLGISIGTVKVHLSLAYSVLGARNRIEAVMRAGLLR